MAELRLQKVLAGAGVASRRECEELILEGVVRVNRNVVDTLPAFVDVEKDVIKLETPAVFNSIVVSPGEFAVFYPNDIHRPNCCVDAPITVRKICMKVRI